MYIRRSCEFHHIHLFQDNSLVKIVDRFSRLSKDYMDLQSKYEQTKEELIEERTRKNEDSFAMNQGSKVLTLQSYVQISIVN